jgi:hypothetical protein
MNVSLYSKINDMKKYELKIEQDTDPMNPRTEWDNVTTMVCFGKYSYLGDKTNYKRDEFDSWDELKEQIENDHKVAAIKPLYVYDHGGITISTSPFNDRFDTSRIGWVFITLEQLKLMYGENESFKLNEIIDGEVKTYDQYLTGEVYKYSIYEIETCSLGHEHKNFVEGCGSYFGEEECESEGQSVLQHLEKELQTN